MLRAYGWEPIASALDAARKRHPQLAELIDLYEGALRLVHGTAVELDLSRLEPSRLQMRLVQGEPMLPRERFVVDLAATARLLDGLGELVAARGPAQAAAVEAIRGSVPVDSLVARVLAEPGAPEALAAERGLDEQVLRFLARFALWPSLEACASGLDEYASAIGWDQNVCPVCGCGAGLAELRGDEGARWLHCSFCGFRWAFARLGCPYCGNTDHNRLEMLYAERDRRAHLSVCHACRAYLKTIDNKEYGGLIPAVEDLASPHLDLVAGDRGLRRIVF